MEIKELKKFMQRQIDESKDLLGIDNDDHIIAILRHFEWNIQRLQDTWFSANQDKLLKDIGINYDTMLVTKYKDINDTLAQNNEGMCKVMYCDFD